MSMRNVEERHSNNRNGKVKQAMVSLGSSWNTDHFVQELVLAYGIIWNYCCVTLRPEKLASM